jgi:uncharacterized protein (DUF1499 family)
MHATWLLLLLALVNAVAFALSGFGTRFGLWDWITGFTILRVAAYAALGIGALAIVAMLIPRLGARGTVNAVAAVIISLGVLAIPLRWMQLAKTLPVITDVTSDIGNPPPFVAILPLRAGAPVPSAHPGAAVAQAQRAAYPDIAPLVLSIPPNDAFVKAANVARMAGWEIVAADSVAGRIEAVATTPWFGFKDDVVVRITATPTGSRIDVRSVSRVGQSDLGTNAERIRTYLAKVAA